MARRQAPPVASPAAAAAPPAAVDDSRIPLTRNVLEWHNEETGGLVRAGWGSEASLGDSCVPLCPSGGPAGGYLWSQFTSLAFIDRSLFGQISLVQGSGAGGGVGVVQVP